jgi:hypothetical protein
MDFVGSDSWQADAYGALSVTYRVASAIRQHSAVINLAGKLWKVDRSLARVMEDIYKAAENPPAVPPPMPSPEQLTSAIGTLRNIHAAVDNLYGRVQSSSNLKNRSLIAGPLMSMRSHADDILDLAEWLELLMNSEVENVFTKSIEEYHRGEYVSLESIG